MFSFDIRHVARRKNGGPDALSRRGKLPEDSDSKSLKELENEMDADLAPA